jgi:hypothetical protein
MNEIATLSKALVKAQKEFNPALKKSNNPHFKSKYVDLAGCVEAVIDALNNNGIFLSQHTYEHNEGIVIETVFTHESGEQMNCGRLFFPANKQDPQGFMSCLTYIRRASLMTATGQAPEDDDGNATVKTSPEFLEMLVEMEQCKTLGELQVTFSKAINLANGNKGWVQKFTEQKDKLKQQLKDKQNEPTTT